MFKKDQDHKPQTPQHEDFERNKADAIKLKDFWETKLEGHRSRIRFHLGADTLYLSYNRVIGGHDYVYSSPHTYSQPWPDFRAPVTKLFQYCEILGERDDRNASGEWKRKFGIKVIPDENSYGKLFPH